MNKLNILIAYPYFTPEIISALKERKESIRLLIDSGAFTAWKAGKEISIDSYCKFLEKLPFKPWRYFTLDKIGDPKGTRENYNTMLKRGFKPIPIFTRGDNPKSIEDYYETSDLIGVGGLVGTRKNKGFVKGIMEVIKKRKCHWLGFLNREFILKYRPYSFDSSSVGAAMRYGNVNIFDNRIGKFFTIQKKHFKDGPPKRYFSLLKTYDIDPKDLAKKKNWNHKFKEDAIARDLSFRSHIRASIAIENKIGTLYFLAISVEAARVLELFYKFYLKERKRI